LLFDFKIRELTNNNKSLDDVMRLLYREYYQKKKRGFSEEELKAAFETVAGGSLAEEFEYVTTTKELDYPKYFSYAGLQTDTSIKELPGAYAGFSSRERNDSVSISAVDFESPAVRVRPQGPDPQCSTRAGVPGAVPQVEASRPG
jgi:predicted metalloprotease with PDZ domain